jgi:hypothetical protein
VSIRELESAVEKRLCKTVRERGGECLKFVSPGRRGVTDRIVLLPGARIMFIETKTVMGKLSPSQRRFHKRLTELGFKVRVMRR